MSATPHMPAMDERAKQVLRNLVQRYLQDGQPVGSRTLANNADLSLSAATIRNVMADLEEQGMLVSPHTSAGRIPSPRGIRFFIDRFLTVAPVADDTLHHLQSGLQRETVTEVQSAAAEVISQLTKYVGFVALPVQQMPVIRKLRFVKLSTDRVLAVIVTSTGDVLNRVFVYDSNVTESALNAAAAAYNRYFANMTFGEAKTLLHGEMRDLRHEIGNLLRTLLERVDDGQEAADAAEAGGVLQVAGEVNLLKEEELSTDMRKLRDLYELLERKNELMRLLERGDKAENVNVFIGSESGLTALDEFSVVFSPFGNEEGKPLGLIGVVGPKRMRYNQVIPTVDVAAKLLRGVMEDLRLPNG